MDDATRPPRVSIFIVNWNTRDLLRACLSPLPSDEGLELEVLVVDNGSTDGSAEMVDAEFPQVRLLRDAPTWASSGPPIRANGCTNCGRSI